MPEYEQRNVNTAESAEAVPSGRADSRTRFELTGWILFVLCAFFYIASSIESGSVTSLVGSVIFLLACFVFIAPLIRDNRSPRQ